MNSGGKRSILHMVLTGTEFDNLKSQFVTSSWGGRRKLPFAFTEHSVIMLSSVLNSKFAAQINISVVKAFAEQTTIINEIITRLNNLIEPSPKAKRKIGFKPD